MSVNNIFSIINIENNQKYIDATFKCDSCEHEYNINYCTINFDLHHSCMYNCCKCNKIYCHECIIKLGDCDKYYCELCVPQCYVENCNNISFNLCNICNRQLCSDHSREKNYISGYKSFAYNCMSRKLSSRSFCDQKISLKCARYAKQNKKMISSGLFFILY